ncbi:MAG: lytic transglycosylase domain-containing protein [Pseudomonadota bacterium]
MRNFGKNCLTWAQACSALVVVAVCSTTVGAGFADTSRSSSSRASLFSSQTNVLDRRGAAQYEHSARFLPQRTGRAAEIPSYRGSYAGPYLSMAKAAARRHGIPEDLFLRLVQQESAFNAKAVSHKGAIGLAQLMPGTARDLGVNPHDPRQNLDGGARYLRTQYQRFRDWKLALAAYNAGPEAVARHNGIPPYKETRNYVRRIMGTL